MHLLRKLLDRAREDAVFLLKGRHLPLTDRIRAVMKRDRNTAGARALLARALDRNTDPEMFELDGVRIAFLPDYEVKDLEQARLGAAQVVFETFVIPDFFSRNARIKQGDVVFDLGANIGTTSMLFSRMVGERGSVHAFEPVVHATMLGNLERNGIRNVTLNPLGVSDQKGDVEIEISDFGLDSSICHREYTTGYYTNTRKISLTDLDSYCREHDIKKIDLIKMDIEGAEELALRGAVEVIRKFRPVWTISSYHTDFQNEPQHPKLLRILKEHGYRIEEKPFKRIIAY